MRKGSSHTLESRIKMSLSRKGVPKPSDFGEKISQALKGKSRSWRVHPSTTHRKGKTWEEIFGEESARKRRETNSRMMAGRNTERCLGKTFVEMYGNDRAKEIKAAISPRGRVYSQEWLNKNRERLREASSYARSFIKTPSNLEKIVWQVLEENGIQFKHSVRIGPYEADIVIEPNLIIECDGDYWHNLPHIVDRDKIRDSYLADLGYIVKRFKESDIKDNPSTVLDYICSFQERSDQRAAIA